MIVVGGWPGRNVVGLNGRFGVRPAAFAVGGDFDNPFLDDVDPGDDTTEFVGVVQSLPGSGAVVFDDDGGFSHTGAADGTYATVFRLYTWAQGGPITEHSPDETITTTFGSTSTAAGVTIAAAASLIAGAATGQIGATAAGATVAAAAALVAGSASGQIAATAAGQVLTASASLVPGSAAGAAVGTALGATITAAASLLAGAAAGQVAATAAGATVSAAAALLAGEATGEGAGVAPGASLSVAASLITGAADGQASSTADGAVLTIACALIAGSSEGALIYRPTSDVDAAGWQAVPPGSLYEAIDEAAPASDDDYITSVMPSAGPAVFGIPALPAGTYTLRVRAAVTFGVGTLRLRLLDGTGAVLGTSADQAIDATPATYALQITIGATASRMSIEVEE